LINNPEPSLYDEMKQRRQQREEVEIQFMKAVININKNSPELQKAMRDLAHAIWNMPRTQRMIT